jgi:predicted  nucleic acid-binding Zn-ribbon protein
MKTNESHSSRRYKDENDTNSSSDNQNKELVVLKNSFEHIKKVNSELVESVRALTDKKYVEDIKDLDAKYQQQISQYNQTIKQMRAQITSLESSISVLAKRKDTKNKQLQNEETQWQWDNSAKSNFSNYVFSLIRRM